MAEGLGLGSGRTGMGGSDRKGVEESNDSQGSGSGVTVITGSLWGSRAQSSHDPKCRTGGIANMLTSLLLEKLLELERSVGHTDPLQLRAMLMEA